MRFNLIPPRHTAASAVRQLAEGLASGTVILRRGGPKGDGLEPGRTTVIRYRCPSCRNVGERPDRDAGQTVACTTCGQKLQVPPAPKAVLAAEPLPPARKRSWVDWVWRPAPQLRRENSGETLIRFGVNVLRAGFLFWATTWIVCILIAALVAAVRGH